MDLDRFRGVFTASVTPFTENGSIDEEAAGRLMEYYVQNGLKGAFINSSSGEHFSMTQEQRCRSMCAAAKADRGRITLLANVSDDCLKRSEEQADLMAEAGADAVVCMPPRFNLYDDEELASYFTQIADRSPVPVIIYNHMVRLNNKLSVDFLLRMSEHPNIIGVKDTHNDAARLMTLLSRLSGRDDFIVWAGGDGMAGFAALMGGYMLNALSAVDPGLMLALQKAGEEHDVAQVMRLQQQVNKLLGLFKVGYPNSNSISGLFQSIKGALSLKGLCGTHTAQLGRELTERDISNIQKFLDEING